MKNKLIFLVLMCVIFGCDPTVDNKMVFYNNSSEDIIIRMIFIDDNITETWGGFREIKANSEQRIGKLVSWASEFKDAEDSILNVVIFKNYESLYAKYKGDKIHISDSLLSIGDYKVHKYSYSYLKNNKWRVKYPDDGFLEGDSLNVVLDAY